MNEQVDPTAVIESLSNQIASLSRDIAILQALNAQFRTKIAEIESPTAVLDNQ